MWIQTQQDLQTMIERLARRTPQSLARFIAELSFDDGPIGEHVRTFMVGDDAAQTLASLTQRIEALRDSPPRYHRHQDGKQYGERFGYIVDAIETLLLPTHAEAAFDLLVQLFERDGEAMENCAGHHDTVTNALERAAALMAQVAPSLPAQPLRMTLRRLIAQDGYGTRRSLVTLVEALSGDE
jgi:hypothetical protein